MIWKKKKPLLSSVTIHDNLVQHKGIWMIAMKIQSVDLDSRSEFDKEATLEVFQQLLKTLSSNSQIIYRKTPLKFEESVYNISLNAISLKNDTLTQYAFDYAKFLKEISSNKMDKINYLIVKTEKKCSEGEAMCYLMGVYGAVQQILSNVNIKAVLLKGDELEELYQLPEFIKEEVDYFVYGNEMKRTYVVKEYPRCTYPNWLKPILDYHYPIELTQHIHPLSRFSVMKQLEVVIAKIISTMELQEANGDVVSSELRVRLEDTEDLLRRLASGSDNVVYTSFYITISASNLETLNNRSAELESYMRQCGLIYRTARKEVMDGIKSIAPLCDNQMLEAYMLDTTSLSTILPFTVQDYTDKEGVLYGVNNEETEMITVNRWAMPNPNMLVLGKSGFGKGMFSKIETARQIVDGAKAIIIDHDGEWKEFCELLGGVYIDNPKENNIPWLSHLLVFSSESKSEALQVIWNHIVTHDLCKYVLVIDEFHNILNENKVLMLKVIKEIRKHGVAPTLITQNVRDLLRSEEGQMIFDNCSIRLLLRQGENDIEEIERLFDLSRNEKIYLKTCPVGRGLLYTDLYKTKIKVVYSEDEEDVLSTNPFHKIRRIKK